MSAEASSVRFGGTRIAYVVRRTSRVKTVAIAVDPEEGVVVTAPRGTDVARLDSIVHAKGRWILGHLREVLDHAPRPAPREFVSGETFVYGGRQHTLRVLAGEPVGASMDHGRLLVRLPRDVFGSGPEVRAAAVRMALVRWWRARAAERVPPVAEAWQARLGVSPARVSVVEQARRWGSCTQAGEVRINWRVVGAGRRVLEYVVAHELVHLRHPDHTAAFWRRLGEAMPDYEERRAQLRELGASLVW